MPFSTLGLSPKVLEGVRAAGYTDPTPIQLRGIPLVMSGRDLIAQVETAIHDYARFTNLRTVVLFGGTGYGRQDQALRQGVDILVATPGRLLDPMQRGM